MTETWDGDSAAADTERTTADRLVLDNLTLAQSVARRFFRRNASRDEDLVQVAYIGLVKAARRFDPEKGRSFAAFAVPTITGEIKRHLRDAGWFVRPPRRVQELRGRIVEASPRLAQAHGHAPTVAELVAELGEPSGLVQEALACQDHLYPASLDVPVSSDRETTVGELLPGDGGELERAEFAAVLSSAMRALSPRDRRVVELRFFDDLTQHDIAALLGVTQMQVSRILTRTLGALRDHIRHGPPPRRLRSA
ncbi:sigma-70 family RNA polymerase sigma factor [Microbacterium album]|uniref:RNA polymerase subunit sigma n=1 Tax=Microbacterium album TaxID=2053191 RepID=A0A917IGV1_9MICO|nr:sigma-70 family RNA polymerase sigma factor [Microbacterium album]GGH45573.1 hypothetical protein GCM10010921_21060 [Microbacterium album]